MRKNKLIELLSQIPGNPEIMLWNGFVEDYNKIDPEITEMRLVKHSREFLSRAHRPEEKPPTHDEVEESFREQEWEFPNQFVKPEYYKDWYGKHQKTVYVLSGKRRHKEYWDRAGSLSY